jgi:hypothetical protein
MGRHTYTTVAPFKIAHVLTDSIATPPEWLKALANYGDVALPTAGPEDEWYYQLGKGWCGAADTAPDYVQFWHLCRLIADRRGPAAA